MRRNPRFALVLALLAAAALPALAEIETFNFDKAHTQVGFRIRHFVSKVEGRFNKFDGTILLDRQNPGASKVDLTIQADSIDTNNENRDKDLRSENFFDVAKFPTITFKSTRVEALDSANWKVTGELTIRGVTRPVVLDTRYLGQAIHPFAKKMAAGFRAETTIDRRDFGVTWNAAMDTGGAYLGERVQISLTILAARQD